MESTTATATPHVQDGDLLKVGEIVRNQWKVVERIGKVGVCCVVDFIITEDREPSAKSIAPSHCLIAKGWPLKSKSQDL